MEAHGDRMRTNGVQLVKDLETVGAGVQGDAALMTERVREPAIAVVTGLPRLGTGLTVDRNLKDFGDGFAGP